MTNTKGWILSQWGIGSKQESETETEDELHPLEVGWRLEHDGHLGGWAYPE